MFRVFFSNFGYYSQYEGKTLDEAKSICRKACFQARIEENGVLVATYCPLAGFRNYRLSPQTEQASAY